MQKIEVQIHFFWVQPIVHRFWCLQLFIHVSLQFLTSLKLGHCSKLNWPKGSLQFIGSLGHYFTPVMLYFRSFFKTFKLFVFIEAPLVCIIGHLQSLSTYIRILKTQTAFDNYQKKSGFLDDYSGFLDDYSVGLITLLFFFCELENFFYNHFRSRF